jgi:hypothetical protein
MEKEFIPYKQSLALKELGFDEPCFAWYDGRYPSSINQNYCKNSEEWLNTIHCATPTYSQAFRFFREKYKIFSSIMTEYSYGGTISAYHINGLHQSDISKGDFYTYEEAELACLIKLIELVKENEKGK